MVKDAIGRRWQLGTIQVDYNLPERFELEYSQSFFLTSLDDSLLSSFPVFIATDVFLTVHFVTFALG